MAPVAFSLFLLTLHLSPLRARDSYCPTTDIPNNMCVVVLGFGVILRCGGKDEAENETRGNVTWERNRKHLQGGGRWVRNGDMMRLESAQVSDTAAYRCLRDGHFVRSIRLLVAERPETPRVKCSVRSYTSPVRCEWSSGTFTRYSRCQLTVRKSLGGALTVVQCRLYTSRSRCVCLIPWEDEILSLLYVRLYVNNSLDCEASTERSFYPRTLLKPDAPESVRVRRVTNASHKLNVSWNYPVTWKQDYYRLRFQIRYRFQQDLPFTEEYVPSTDTHFEIADAFPKRNYTVQVRALEEFDNGLWSEWSSEAFGFSFSAPVVRNPASHPEDTEGFSSAVTEPELWEEEMPRVEETLGTQTDALTRFTPVLVIVSLLPLILISVLILLRYKKHMKTETQRKGVDPSPSYLPIQLISVQSQEVFLPPRAEEEGPEQVGGKEIPPNTPQPSGQFDMMNLSYFYIGH
uniref:Interleukin-6 receptor subunit alpha-like protein n=1 Tax=Callorhinchus milii TaxID=7868 RepID=V9KSL7_CALMI